MTADGSRSQRRSLAKRLYRGQPVFCTPRLMSRCGRSLSTARVRADPGKGRIATRRSQEGEVKW